MVRRSSVHWACGPGLAHSTRDQTPSDHARSSLPNGHPDAARSDRHKPGSRPAARQHSLRRSTYCCRPREAGLGDLCRYRISTNRDLLTFSDYRYRLVDSRILLRERRHQPRPKTKCASVRSVAVRRLRDGSGRSSLAGHRRVSKRESRTVVLWRDGEQAQEAAAHRFLRAEAATLRDTLNRRA
jgi:hypothetical protein